jgi:hypothetical protein
MAKKKSEWREIVNVHSIELFRSDVIELINLLSKCEDFDRPEMNMRVTSNSQTIEFDPINEDFNDFEIDKSNQINIKLTVWRDLVNENGQSNYAEQEIVSGIDMNMHVNHVNFQIHSNSEVWFRGKKEQLTRFFESKKPVIPNRSNNYKVLWLIKNIIFFLSFILVIYFLLHGKYSFTFISAVVVILTFIVPIRKAEIIEPPFVMVCFFDRPPEENTQKKEIPLILIVEIIMLVVAIIGLFIK